MKILVIGDFHGKVSAKLKKEISKREFDFIISVGDYAGIKEWYSYIKYVFNLKILSAERKSPQEFYGKEKYKDLIKKDFKAGEEVFKFLDSLGKPGFYIFGNGDDEWYNHYFGGKFIRAKKSRLNFLKKIKNIKEMNYKIRKYKRISFLGFGGYLDAIANEKHRDKEWQKRVDLRIREAEKKIYSLIKKIDKKAIFVFHYPPLGVFDKILDKKNPYYKGSTGINVFRKAILKKKPSLVLCGHMHEYQGKKKLGYSVVVNPGAAIDGKFAIINLDEKEGKIRKIEFYNN